MTSGADLTARAREDREPAGAAASSRSTHAANDAAASLDARVVVERGSFRLDAEVRAVEGEVVALMGPSGAGKSTLLAVLAGLAAPDGGHTRLGPRTLDAAGRPSVPPSRRGMVLLGQDARLFPHLTAHANVAFGLRAHGASKADAAAAADDWLRRVGLGGIAERRPSQLSGGQQQRVALARALATRPAVLLLDEPFTSLDTETAGDVRALVHDQLAATGTTAIVATHDAVDAVALARTLAVLEDGRVTQSGPVRDVLAAPATRFAAAVAGLNRVPGVIRDGLWRSGELALIADGAALVRERSVEELHASTGDAVQGSATRSPARPASAGLLDAERAAVFSPADVHVFPAGDSRPPREGEWNAQVTRLEQTPAGVRVRTAEPDVAVDLAADRAASLGLTPGAHVRLRIDPRDVRYV